MSLWLVSPELLSVLILALPEERVSSRPGPPLPPLTSALWPGGRVSAAVPGGRGPAWETMLLRRGQETTPRAPPQAAVLTSPGPWVPGARRLSLGTDSLSLVPGLTSCPEPGVACQPPAEMMSLPSEGLSCP